MIAMFLTLGYTRRQVAWAYSSPALMPIVAALLLGCGFARRHVRVPPELMRGHRMPKLHLVFQLPYLWRARLVLCDTVALGKYLPMCYILGITPMDALRDVGAGQK